VLVISSTEHIEASVDLILLSGCARSFLLPQRLMQLKGAVVFVNASESLHRVCFCHDFVFALFFALGFGSSHAHVLASGHKRL